MNKRGMFNLSRPTGVFVVLTGVVSAWGISEPVAGENFFKNRALL